MNIFNNWNKLKQKIHNLDQKTFYVKQREVWYINMWVNIWAEENGKKDDFRRPVLVLKKIWSLYLCIAMTTKWKDNNFFYHKYKENSYIILSQTKTIDRKRFLDKIDVINKEEFTKITKKLKTMWF
jgi:mRNA interferase MazF